VLRSFVPTLRGLQNDLRQSAAALVVRRNVRWLLMGLAIRLALMPFATHPDLIGLTWFSSFIAFGSGNPYSAVPISQVLPYPPAFFFLDAAWLRLVRLFFPDLPAFIFGLNPGSPTAQFFGSPYYLYPYINELLAALKVPYLIFDISTGIILSLVVNENTKSDFLFRFWMLNPVAIFVSFIWGQMDIIPTFFVILAVYLASRSKPGPAALSLGLGASFKLFPLMLLPILILGLGKSLVQRVRLAFWGVVPLLIVSIPFVTTKAYTQNLFFSEAAGRITVATIQYGSWSGYVFAIFVALYTVIVLHFSTSEEKQSAIWRSMFAILLCLYSFAVFDVQWFLWVAPLAGVAIASDRKFLWSYILMCICYLVYTFYWGTATAGVLFAPLNPSFFLSLPAPSDLIAGIMDPIRFIVLFRSVFTGTALWSAYLALRNAGSKGIAVVTTPTAGTST
jgi:hypothetical protein